MKEQVKNLVDSAIESENCFVFDAFVSTEEGKQIFNIVVDSEEVIDLNKVTAVSRIINDIMDKHPEVLGDVDELDIYSNSKGEVEDEQ